MRKRLIVLVCVLCFSFVLAACGNSENNENPQGAGTSSTTVAEESTLTLTETPTDIPNSIPDHEHSYTSEVTKDPSCEENGQGEITYTCSCGDTYTEETDRIDHCTDDIDIIQEATCSQVGIKTYSCIFCRREFEREELPKLPHTESDWIVVTEVTATTDGL